MFFEPDTWKQLKLGEM